MRQCGDSQMGHHGDMALSSRSDTVDDGRVEALGRILAVWAHPDDETYLAAGVMARARDLGNEVVVVTATAGETGTPDPDHWPPDRLAKVRLLEVEAAMAVLGVEDHRYLGRRDGACSAVPWEEAVGELTDIVTETRPDTILTFGPDGITGHPDHRAVSCWTVEAWRRAGRRPRLLFATTPPGDLVRFEELHRELGVFMDGFRACPSPVEHIELDVVLRGDELDRKLVALRAQASQTTAIVDHMGECLYREWVDRETFVAGPRV